ncbi:MAG TPA: hypothetical protein ENG34_00305 [Candidatus Aenigmarchaeota archaeon]|nr:hypothetical protein [Candidatus Aenigmarchaeota archaeon]
MEFWNESVTDRAWKVLIKLVNKFDPIVIGGWAAYLLTKTLKSKDIDVVVDFETLQKLKIDFGLKKNIHLKKYEAIVDEVSIDIYVPYFSKLAIPPEDLQKLSMRVEGIRIAKPEALLILKQQAELERKDSIKGLKDRVDILNILINSKVDFKKYHKLIEKYKLEDYPKRLESIIKTAKKEFDYLGMKNLRKIRLMKKRLLIDLRSHTLSW